MTKYFRIVLIVIFVISFRLILVSQNKKNDGYYVGAEGETILMQRSIFKIYTGNFNSKPGIIAHGGVKYYPNGFVELNSDNYCDSLLKTIRYVEQKLPQLQDSLCIKVSFPLENGYRIKFHINNKIDYELINSNMVTIPVSKFSKKINIEFEIINTNELVGSHGYYQGIRSFNNRNSKYTLSLDQTNYLTINILGLTKFYFEQYLIKGEFARIQNGMLWWRGECYEKFR